tara:strand:- start:735 stop:1271 length:537 start_codon:yes stop_codon:yes gene_type:complete
MPIEYGLSKWDREIKNKNFLSPTGFKFSLEKAPKVDFFANSVNIPGINLGVAVQSTPLKDLMIPGDKLVYNDFSIQFMVDENMENYLEIHDWMRGLGYPESMAEALPFGNVDPIAGAFSDGAMIIYNSNYIPITKVKFKDLFPVSLSPVQFDAKATDINYIMAEATFKYTIFDIESLL